MVLTAQPHYLTTLVADCSIAKRIETVCSELKWLLQRRGPSASVVGVSCHLKPTLVCQDTNKTAARLLSICHQFAMNGVKLAVACNLFVIIR